MAEIIVFFFNTSTSIWSLIVSNWILSSMVLVSILGIIIDTFFIKDD